MPKRKLAGSRRRPGGSKFGARAGRRFAKLVEVQAQLRGPGGCPWDRKQTHDSLRPYLLEETYEVLDALDGGDDRKLVSELGDLLLQVVFHAQLAAEEGRFDAGDVAQAIREKLIRRHPHVFGSRDARALHQAGGRGRVRTAGEVLKRWEELKAEERHAEGQTESESLLDGVPKNLPALSEAFQLTRRASNVGFDWKRLEGVLAKLEEEARELRRVARRSRVGSTRGGKKAGREAPKPPGRGARRRIEEETGDLLFTSANVARFLGLDPEMALKRANGKFARRFRWMEGEAERRGARLGDMTSYELERLWNQAKASQTN